MDKELNDENYESPNGSEWIVAVDKWGMVTILKTPNIHYSLLDPGNAEEIGLPFEVEDKIPGVYKWKCNLHVGTDWETGYVDELEFEVIEETLLWSVE